MDNTLVFKIFLIAAIIASVIITRKKKLNGGFISFAVTSFIFIFGLNFYSRPDWTLNYFGLEVSKEFFIVLIIIWYIFDIYQIIEAERVYKYFFISWLVPGLGHFMQKKHLKGIVFLSGILLLLILGLLMQGKFYTAKQFHPLLILGFIGDLGSGMFFFIIEFLGLSKGNVKVISHNYGTTYLVAAGLINYLVALNAFDIARGKRK